MSNFTFTADSITVAGKTYSAAYSITKTGAVMAFVTVPGAAEVQRVRFPEGHPDHAAALAAAKAEKAAHAAEAAQVPQEQPADTPAVVAAEADERETIPEGYTATVSAAGNIVAVQRNEYTAEAEQEQTAEAPAAETVQAAQAEPEQPAAGQLPQDAPAPAASKDFIGQTITGNGWRILFDGETSRTRVIFDTTPTAAAAAALEKAGFYFSKAMNSYNKKLTCKAHRAAVALSGELRALYA